MEKLTNPPAKRQVSALAKAGDPGTILFNVYASFKDGKHSSFFLVQPEGGNGSKTGEGGHTKARLEI
jgi:hypothetical protein